MKAMLPFCLIPPRKSFRESQKSLIHGTAEELTTGCYSGRTTIRSRTELRLMLFAFSIVMGKQCTKGEDVKRVKCPSATSHVCTALLFPSQNYLRGAKAFRPTKAARS